MNMHAAFVLFVAAVSLPIAAMRIATWPQEAHWSMYAVWALGNICAFYFAYPPSNWSWQRTYACRECGDLESSPHRLCRKCGEHDWVEGKARLFWRGWRPEAWFEATGDGNEFVCRRRARKMRIEAQP